MKRKPNWRRGWHETFAAVRDQLRTERWSRSDRRVLVGRGPAAEWVRIKEMEDCEITEYAEIEATRRAERSIMLWNERQSC